MGVALGGADVAVAEDLLDGGQRNTAMNADGGTGYAGTVEGEMLPDVQLPGDALDEHVGATIHGQAWEQTATGVDEL